MEPEHLGPYQIDSLLGRGGMGSVHLARDTRTGERVALKVMAAELVEEGDGIKRFEQELDALTRLDHAGITRALSPMQRDGDRVFFALEYVEGTTLAQHLKATGALPADEAVEFAEALFAALAAAHAVDIVHRDVKPANVLLPADGHPGDLKVADFGLARLADVTRLTLTGQLMGTLSYMAPEQCEGRQDLDARVDIYAAGVVLFEMLAGGPPFRSDTPAAVLRAHLVAPPPDLATLRGDIPQDLVDLVRDCLEKRREDRVQTAAQALDRLRALPPLEATTKILRDLPDATEVPTVRGEPTRTSPPPARKGRLALLVGIPALVLLTVLALAFLAGRTGADDPSPAAAPRQPRTSRISKADIERLVRTKRSARRIFRMAGDSLGTQAERGAWRTFADARTAGDGDVEGLSITGFQHDTAARLSTVEFAIDDLPAPFQVKYTGLRVTFRRSAPAAGKRVRRRPPFEPVEASLIPR